MSEKNLIDVISDLIQVDIDAQHSYGQAIEHIDDDIIRKRLKEFMGHHQAHIEDLSEQVKTLGGKPPKLSRDVKGVVIEGFTVLRSSTGTVGALKALKTTEEITNRHYAKALPLEVSSSLKEIFRKHLSEERIHLDYITSNLEALS